LIISIDGPVGAGKSSVAKMLAQRLGYAYIDSGAMYRAVAWEALRQGIDLEDEAALSSLIDATKIDFREGGGNTRTYIGGRDVSDEIRSPEASQASSIISTFEGVRKRLVAMQREMGRRNERGAVIEGRDIGTVVFPDADIKFYLDSSIAERAKRRQMDLLRSGVTVDLSETVREIQIRDDRDSQRRLSPLKPAADSTLIDSTRLKLEEVVDLMLNRIRSALQEREG
jgi:cytidylate kinase